jgi:predicted flap endonuclease-1-like 5' DNA nuclease
MWTKQLLLKTTHLYLYISIYFKKSLIMSYNIIDIEGIGAAYAEKLNAAGINTTDDLLEKGGTKAGRKALAEASGVDEGRILTWVNHSDLHRIDGIAGQFSELLESAGVDTVKELATRNAENLNAKMQEVNDSKNLSGRVPSAEQLQKMIDQAKTMEQKVFH